MYYYSIAQPIVGTAGQALTTTILNLQNLHVGVAANGERATIQKLIVGWSTGSAANAPADTAMVALLQRSSTLLTPGTANTATPMAIDSPAATAVTTTTPTGGAFATATPVVQLGFNGRGTAMWAAFVPDEGIGLWGSTAALGNEVCLRGYGSASSPINYTMIFSQ